MNKSHFIFLFIFMNFFTLGMSDCVSLQLTPSSSKLLLTAASENSLMIRMHLTITQNSSRTTSSVMSEWVAVQSTSLLNILPAARFYTFGQIASEFSFISLNLTGTSCSPLPSQLDVQSAVFSALATPLDSLQYTLCESHNLILYQCCLRSSSDPTLPEFSQQPADAAGNATDTCLAFSEITVALFPLTLQVLITGGLGCFLFFYVASGLQRWNFYGTIQQNAELVTCPAIHLVIHSLIRKTPHLYRHVIYWAQLFTFGLLIALAAIFVTMQPNEWPHSGSGSLTLPNYADNPRFYFAIVLSPLLAVVAIVFMRYDLGPVRPSPQSASVFLFACRRRTAGATWWGFFNFVKLVNIDAILERVVTRWVMTAMLLILLSFGILLFYDSGDFSQLIGITLTTIMPVIPRLAQTATPVVIEFERGYLKERVTEILAALDTGSDRYVSTPVLDSKENNNNNSNNNKNDDDNKNDNQNPKNIQTNTNDTTIVVMPDGPSDDSGDETFDPQQQEQQPLFIQDSPSPESERYRSGILADTVSDPILGANPHIGLQSANNFTNQRSNTERQELHPSEYWKRRHHPLNDHLNNGLKGQFKQIFNLNMASQSICWLSTLIVGFAQYFILWGFDDRTLALTSNLKFIFWALVSAFAALYYFRTLPQVSLRAVEKHSTMPPSEWIATMCFVIGLQTICILAADALTIFAWSVISYAVVYPSPGLLALGFFLAILSSFLILSNELSDPFLLIRIFVRDAGRLLPETHLIKK